MGTIVRDNLDKFLLLSAQFKMNDAKLQNEL